MADIGIPAPGENVAFLKQRGDLRGKPALAARMACDHHVSEPGVERQACQRPPMVGDAALSIQCFKELQQVAGLCHRPRRGPVQEPRLADIGDAPQREFEQERRRIGLQDFRHIPWRERKRLLFRPQPVADPGPEPSGTPAALLRCCGRDAHGIEPGQG